MWLPPNLGEPSSTTSTYSQCRHLYRQLTAYSPRTGIYSLTSSTHRALPTQPNPQTHELIHSSVLKQKKLPDGLQETLAKHPELVAELLPLEEELKVNWPFDPTAQRPTDQLDSKSSTGGASATSATTGTSERRRSFFAKAKDTLTRKGGRSAAGDLQAPTVSSEMEKPSATKGGEAQAANHFESFSAFGSYVLEYLKSG